MKVGAVYKQLQGQFGPQGWWPLIDENLIVRHSGRKPKTDSERFEVICGAILTQNTNWYPNVVRALQQLAIGRQLTEKEQEALKQAEITAGEYLQENKRKLNDNVLTQNTNWKNVEKALYMLSKHKLIDPRKIKMVDHESLATCIRSSGYYNQKAERLKAAADFFLKNDSPNRDQLLAIKGIGPETADSILLYAYGQPVFVIDAYTKRIFERLGYRLKKYEEWQNLFMDSLPKDPSIYNEYHALLVELGKNYCRTKPVCKGCPVKRFCKSYINKTFK